MMSSLGLTPKQMAERMGKTVRTLTQWRKDGNGPPYIECEGRIHYPEKLYRRWVKQHTRGEAA